MQTNAVILFDGVCNFCTWSVQFIINRDPRCYFKFVPIQSGVGRRLMEAYGFRRETMESFILIEGASYLTKSSATIRVSQHLSGLWSILVFVSIIPRPIRDWCYDVIARNRYK